MAVVKLEAFKQLLLALQLASPGMDMILVRQKAGVQECFPNLVVTPIRLRYEPDQSEEKPSANPSLGVFDVGNFDGMVQLRLTASNLADRWEREQQIVDLFLRTEDHPGVLMTPVTTCPQFGKFMASWELEDDQWSDAKAADGRFESVIVVNASIPALVTRVAHRVNELRLGLVAEIGEILPAAMGMAPGTEIVSIGYDGSITAV